jgi:hypothetical protein
MECHCSDADLKRQIDYLDVKGPREKYVDPVTENQRYLFINYPSGPFELYPIFLKS